jgi:hypothetical protein
LDFYGFLNKLLFVKRAVWFNPCGDLTRLPGCTLMLFSQLKGVVPAKEVRF